MPDLTGAKHRVYSTGKTTSGGEPGDLPSETLFDPFVGLREPAVGRVRDVAHDGPDEGAPQPTVRSGWDRSVANGPQTGL